MIVIARKRDMHKKVNKPIRRLPRRYAIDQVKMTFEKRDGHQRLLNTNTYMCCVWISSKVNRAIFRLKLVHWGHGGPVEDGESKKMYFLAFFIILKKNNVIGKNGRKQIICDLAKKLPAGCIE